MHSQGWYPPDIQWDAAYILSGGATKRTLFYISN